MVISEYLSLRQVASRLRVHISTCHRWRIRGVSGIRLRTKKIGGRRYVEQAELDRFIDAVTDASDGENSSSRHSAKRDQQIAAAEAELAAIGISSQRSKDKE